MRMEVKTDRVQFLATRKPEPKTDGDGRQKRDARTQELLWQTELVVIDADGADVIKVTTEGEPKIAPGHVEVAELVAMPWAMGDRSGVAYRARSITAVQQPAPSRSGGAS